MKHAVDTESPECLRKSTHGNQHTGLRIWKTLRPPRGGVEEGKQVMLSGCFLAAFPMSEPSYQETSALLHATLGSWTRRPLRRQEP